MDPKIEKGVAPFLVPIAKIDECIFDCTYFLRKDGSFVFAEGYHHPLGGIFGKIIYFPSSEQAFTSIHGVSYGNTTKEWVNGEVRLISHDRQLARHFEIDPGLDPGQARPPFARLRMAFALDEFAGYFDHRRSLRVHCGLSPEINRTIGQVSDLLEIPRERIGCTGSLSFGKFEQEEADDLDLVYYGTVEENARVLETIRQLTREEPARRVQEFGRYWPIRFYNEGVMICSFFCYADPAEIPLRDFSMTVLRSGVRASGVVTDDTHAIYMPPCITLGEAEIDGEARDELHLVVYDGSLRGEFFRGDRIECRGDLVEITRGAERYEALLLVISNDLLSATRAGEEGEG